MSCLLGPIIFNAPSFNTSITDNSSIAVAIACIDDASSKNPSLAGPVIPLISYNASDNCAVDVANIPTPSAWSPKAPNLANASVSILSNANPNVNISSATGFNVPAWSPITCILSATVSRAKPACDIPRVLTSSKPFINFCIFSIGLSAPNKPPMPSAMPLINDPPLITAMPAPKAVIATPACAKLLKSTPFIVCNAFPKVSIEGAANDPNSMNGNSGAISAIAPAIANIPPDAFNNPPPSTSDIDAILSVNAGNAIATKLSAIPNGISASPNAAIATEPVSMNGDAKLSIAAAAPSVISPAANTPIVPSPTSFIKLSPNANGTTAAPNNNIAAAPLTIADEPLPSVFANKANPPNAAVPFIIEVKSTSLNVLNPTAANPTDAPNSAIAAAPLSTLVSPNFLTAFAMPPKKPPLLPPLVILPVIASAFVLSPPNMLPAFSPIDLPVFMPGGNFGPMKSPAASLAPPNSLSLIAPPILLAPACAF